MFTNEQNLGRGMESTAVADGLACLCLAKDRAEALRYESILQEMGFTAWAATVSEGDTSAFGVPLFVDANQRDSASEVLAAFEAQRRAREAERAVGHAQAHVSRVAGLLPHRHHVSAVELEREAAVLARRPVIVRHPHADKPGG